MWRLLIFLFSICLSGLCQTSDFIRKENGRLYRGEENQPYYFIGANYWYGVMLSSQGPNGNRDKVRADLDTLQSIGINHIRTAIFPEKVLFPIFFNKPSAYQNEAETLLQGLDYLLSELEKRNMKITLLISLPSAEDAFPANKEHQETGKRALENHYNTSCEHSFQHHFLRCETCQKEYFSLIRRIISHRSSYNKAYYKDNATIASWQIGVELQAENREQKGTLLKLIEDITTQIKDIDSRHLLSLDNGKTYDFDTDEHFYEQLNNNKNIDYFSFSLWPLEWKWAYRSNLWSSLPNIYSNIQDYMERHKRIASKYDKPLIINAFGLPRDRSFLSPGTPTAARNAFFDYVFARIRNSAQEKDILSGGFLWGWAGHGGSKYTGDYTHDTKGLYSVYDTDSTCISRIRRNALSMESNDE